MPTFTLSNQSDSITSNNLPKRVATSSGVSFDIYDSEYIRPIAHLYDHRAKSERWLILNEDGRSWTEVDPDQLWFWTKEWQAGEQEADEERQQGLTQRFKNVDDLLSFLDE